MHLAFEKEKKRQQNVVFKSVFYFILKTAIQNYNATDAPSPLWPTTVV